MGTTSPERVRQRMARLGGQHLAHREDLLDPWSPPQRHLPPTRSSPVGFQLKISASLPLPTQGRLRGVSWPHSAWSYETSREDDAVVFSSMRHSEIVASVRRRNRAGHVAAEA